jgi:hypothetical protein
VGDTQQCHQMQIAFSDIYLLSFRSKYRCQNLRWSLSGRATTNRQEVQDRRDIASQRGKNVEKVDGSMYGVWLLVRCVAACANQCP